VYWAEALDVTKHSWSAAELDRRALMEDLYQRESTSLVRLARLFTDDRNAAEDLVQEAFIRLFHSAHRIQDTARVSAYLRSIVLNLARDHNRRGLMSLRHQEAMIDRSVPELRFYLELSEREIASTLAISPNSVKTHCRRGLAAMAGILEAGS
jgi:DNA-directed RNA polymerase specialized sigma24 family protein